MRLHKELNPREFSAYMRQNYDWYTIYRNNECIGHGKSIFGYYVYVEESGEKHKVISFAECYPPRHAILFVE